jgi:hypothetical protein
LTAFSLSGSNKSFDFVYVGLYTASIIVLEVLNMIFPPLLLLRRTIV